MIKLIISFISVIFISLIAFNSYLYLKQPNMIFFPLQELDATPEDWELAYEAVEIKLDEKSRISGWHLPYPEAKKTILFFHGNGGNISHRGDSLYIFHKLKVNTLIIDYPGYGSSQGHPTEENLYQSALAAWKFLVDERKVDPQNIIIFGRSLGGAVAVDLASQVEAGGLILESTFSSVRDVVDIAFPWMSKFIYLRYSFNSFDKIDKVTSPVLVIHSPDDEVIPFASGIKLFDKIRAAKGILHLEGGHNDGFMQSISSYMQSLRLYIQSI